MKIEDYISKMDKISKVSSLPTTESILGSNIATITAMQEQLKLIAPSLGTIAPMDDYSKYNFIGADEALRASQLLACPPGVQESIERFSKSLSAIKCQLDIPNYSIPVGMSESLTQMSKILSQIAPLISIPNIEFPKMEIPDHFFDLYDSFLDNLCIEYPEIADTEEVASIKEMPKSSNNIWDYLSRFTTIITIVTFLAANPIVTPVVEGFAHFIAVGTVCLEEYFENHKEEMALLNKIYEENKAYHAADLEIKKQILESIEDSNESNESAEDTLK